MSDLSKRLEGLSPEQKELLNKKLTKKGIPSPLLKQKKARPGKSMETETKLHDKKQSASHSRGIGFSLSFFSSTGSAEGKEKYKLLLECATFADTHGFEAIWTPERHFETFGGLYPNPSLLAASLATITNHIQIRAGSVVLPLHNPIRVAEEWAVVDNLSGGRVGISCATGWNKRDFTLAPENFADRRALMFQNLQIIQKLWSGETVTFLGVDGKEIDIEILPRPLQARLPIWLTASGSRETFLKAGELGVGILTMLGPQPVDHLAQNIAGYREALKNHGHDPRSGKVTVVLHTFLGDDLQTVKEKVRTPMCRYLQTYIDQEPILNRNNTGGERRVVRNRDKEDLVSFAFERYFEFGALLGTPDKCAALVESMKGADVDEIACLVDFGLDLDSIIVSLEYLADLCKAFGN